VRRGDSHTVECKVKDRLGHGRKQPSIRLSHTIKHGVRNRLKHSGNKHARGTHKLSSGE
jgi:hypothetical protein